MVIRELDPTEWHRLEGHEIFKNVGIPDPNFTKVLISEDSTGVIVGIWCVVQVLHCEPIWIAEAYRSTTLAGRMWSKMKVLLDHYRVNMIYCFSETPKVADYLGRLGLQELPYRTFLFRKDIN